MLLSPGNKKGDIFNIYLQKSIARWEPSLILTERGNDIKDIAQHEIKERLKTETPKSYQSVTKLIH